MEIIQDAFFIPDDIVTGLATGIYRRISSVVRYAVSTNKGQIVKHLTPIDIKTTEQVQSAGVKLFQIVKRHSMAFVV